MTQSTGQSVNQVTVTELKLFKILSQKSLCIFKKKKKMKKKMKEKKQNCESEQSDNP